MTTTTTSKSITLSIDSKIFKQKDGMITPTSEFYELVGDMEEIKLIGERDRCTLLLENLKLKTLLLQRVDFLEIRNITAKYLVGNRIEVFNDNHIEHLICGYDLFENSTTSQVTHTHDNTFGNLDFIFHKGNMHSIRYNFIIKNSDIIEVTQQERLDFLREMLTPVMQTVILKDI